MLVRQVFKFWRYLSYDGCNPDDWELQLLESEFQYQGSKKAKFSVLLSWEKRLIFLFSGPNIFKQQFANLVSSKTLPIECENDQYSSNHIIKKQLCHTCFIWQAFEGLFDSGEQSMFNAIFDKDGSLNGGSPGYIVANTTQILPPGLASCTAHPTWNAYTCSDVCYRSVWISYPEPGFEANPANAQNSHGQFRFALLHGCCKMVCLEADTVLLNAVSWK